MVTREHPGGSASGTSDLTRSLDESVAALIGDRRAPGLVERLEVCLREPTGSPATGAIGRRPASSGEPWQAEIAVVYWRIHYGARDLENHLRLARAIGPLLPARGGTRENTIEALRSINLLAVGVPRDTLRRTADRCERWVLAARRVRDVDEADRWVPVPQVPGSLPPDCPYCHNLSLRMSLGRSEVRCFTPGCQDMEGHQPVARMEPGGLTGEGVLVFRDDTVVHYREGGT